MTSHRPALVATTGGPVRRSGSDLAHDAAPRRRLALFLGIATGLAACLVLPGCGFHLRGSWELPYESIYLDIPAHSEFGAQLKRTLVGTGAARVADSPSGAQAFFVPTGETRERKILSYNSAGRVREVQLKFRYGFRVRDPAGLDMIAPASIEMSRDLTYDESQTLAKEQEEDLLWRDMLTDLTQQVMRRLAGRKPDPVPAPGSATRPAPGTAKATAPAAPPTKPATP
jgi:LPS-assembly lipoprotein